MAADEHAPQNVMSDAGEIAAFHDRCSDLMRELLEGLAEAPDEPRPFGDVEDALGWPRRRIASVLGGVWRLRTTEFGGRRPYRLNDARASASGHWEIWMDGDQADAVRASDHRAQKEDEQRDREDRAADHEQPAERRRLRAQRVAEPAEPHR